jgi:hypothetical protein
VKHTNYPGILIFIDDKQCRAIFKWFLEKQDMKERMVQDEVK